MNKKSILKTLLLLSATALTASAQTLESFEGVTGSANIKPVTFTSNSQPFTITTANCSGGNFGVFVPSQTWNRCGGGTSSNGGATTYGVGAACIADNCATTSAKFLDAGSGGASNSVYSIKTTNAALFTVKSLFVFPSSDGANNPSAAGGVIFRGKRGGNTIFTVTKTTGFVTDYSKNNGFTFIDFTSGTDYTAYNIDEIEFQDGATANYFAVDNFRWGAKTGAISVTNNASNVAGSTVTLNGNINDNAAATTVTFEYSLSSTLASGITSVTTTPGSVAANAGATGVAANVSGLAHNTTYYYRVKGVNINGTTTGIILSFTTGIGLPIQLSSFNGWYNNSTTQLNWSVAAETSLSHYELEKSTDAVSFSSIASIDATNKGHYSFIDEQPAQGNNYYRLKIVDKDGASEYSATVVVNTNNSSNAINIAPNPVIGKTFSLQCQSLEQGLYDLQIRNMNGQLLHQQAFNYTAGQAAVSFTLPSSLPTGLYTLKVTGNHNSYTKSILIQDK